MDVDGEDPEATEIDYPLTVGFAAIIWIVNGIGFMFCALPTMIYTVFCESQPLPLVFFFSLSLLFGILGRASYRFGTRTILGAQEKIRPFAVFTILLSILFLLGPSAASFYSSSTFLFDIALAVSGLGCGLTGAGFLALYGATSYEEWSPAH